MPHVKWIRPRSLAGNGVCAKGLREAIAEVVRISWKSAGRQGLRVVLFAAGDRSYVEQGRSGLGAVRLLSGVVAASQKAQQSCHRVGAIRFSGALVEGLLYRHEARFEDLLGL